MAERIFIKFGMEICHWRLLQLCMFYFPTIGITSGCSNLWNGRMIVCSDVLCDMNKSKQYIYITLFISPWLLCYEQCSFSLSWDESQILAGTPELSGSPYICWFVICIFRDKSASASYYYKSENGYTDVTPTWMKFKVIGLGPGHYAARKKQVSMINQLSWVVISDFNTVSCTWIKK